MDTFVYRIRTDGGRFICEVQQGDSWRRVCFQYGRVLNTDGTLRASMGEYWKSEKELCKIIERVVGTSARRVREWRTV